MMDIVVGFFIVIVNIGITSNCFIIAFNIDYIDVDIFLPFNVLILVLATINYFFNRLLFLVRMIGKRVNAEVLCCYQINIKKFIQNQITTMFHWLGMMDFFLSHAYDPLKI